MGRQILLFVLIVGFVAGFVRPLATTSSDTSSVKPKPEGYPVNDHFPDEGPEQPSSPSTFQPPPPDAPVPVPEPGDRNLPRSGQSSRKCSYVLSSYPGWNCSPELPTGQTSEPQPGPTPEPQPSPTPESTPGPIQKSTPCPEVEENPDDVRDSSHSDSKTDQDYEDISVPPIKDSGYPDKLDDEEDKEDDSNTIAIAAGAAVCGALLVALIVASFYCGWKLSRNNGNPSDRGTPVSSYPYLERKKNLGGSTSIAQSSQSMGVSNNTFRFDETPSRPPVPLPRPTSSAPPKQETKAAISPTLPLTPGSDAEQDQAAGYLAFSSVDREARYIALIKAAEPAADVYEEIDEIGGKTSRAADTCAEIVPPIPPLSIAEEERDASLIYM